MVYSRQREKWQEGGENQKNSLGWTGLKSRNLVLTQMLEGISCQNILLEYRFVRYVYLCTDTNPGVVQKSDSSSTVCTSIVQLLILGIIQVLILV